MRIAALLTLMLPVLIATSTGPAGIGNAEPLPKVRVTPGKPTFQTDAGQPYIPFGVTYYRPGTGWAPQVWKRFDAEATAADFARLKELGVNCVRVFLSYGSFLMEPQAVSPEGLAKLDQFLTLAEQARIYVHPTGPDHWEGTPTWAREDRIAGDTLLTALEYFWKQVAGRYRGRNVIFAYDLRNEPEVGWDTPTMRPKWNAWLEKRYGSEAGIRDAWGTDAQVTLGQITAPEIKDAPRSRKLLDYQLFREELADEWTRRQVQAIKSADPDALVTVGFIQWSVPSLLPRVAHYSAFRPTRQAPFLDFLEIHFYPLNNGFYEYRDREDEDRNLAYLESVVDEVAQAGKPVVVAEFGWQGGGKLTIDQGKHPAATEEQQARWCRRLVEMTSPLATGWLNWGFYDQPEARDVSQLTGLITADGRIKAWGQEFKRLASSGAAVLNHDLSPGARPKLDWDLCISSVEAGHQFRQEYYRAFVGEK